LILNTIQAYTNLFKCTSSLTLIKENKTQANKRLKDIEQLYKNNIVSRNDLLKAQLQVQQVELQELEVSSELELSKISMNLLLGLASTNPLDVDSNYTNQLQIDQLTINSIDYWENLVMQERPELLSLNNRIEASKKNVQILKSDNYPSFALSGGYIYADINNFLDKLLPIAPAPNLPANPAVAASNIKIGTPYLAAVFLILAILFSSEKAFIKLSLFDISTPFSESEFKIS
jgi:outer membrane protein TolC